MASVQLTSGRELQRSRDYQRYLRGVYANWMESVADRYNRIVASDVPVRGELLGDCANDVTHLINCKYIVIMWDRDDHPVYNVNARYLGGESYLTCPCGFEFWQTLPPTGDLFNKLRLGVDRRINLWNMVMDRQEQLEQGQ